jgi:hypothetical protein
LLRQSHLRNFAAKILAATLVVAVAELTAAQAVPLPRARPLQSNAVPTEEPAGTSQPSACRLRLSSDVAVALSLPPITGPGECGAPDVVRLEAVVLPDKSQIRIAPPAILRCTMAEAVANWVREAAALSGQQLGSVLKTVANLASFDCRSRNDGVGAKLSEHGKANAIDLYSVRLANGKVLQLTDPHVPAEFRESLQQSACARFTTVLGPGSDGYHEDHVHVDLAERRSGYRICQWDVRQPEERSAAASDGEPVPLPAPRPNQFPRRGLPPAQRARPLANK